MRDNSKLMLRDVAICLLLITTGYIIAHLSESFDINWFTTIRKEIFQATLSVLANLATIVGVGFAIYVYKSWYRQQDFIKKDKILDDLYLAFLDLSSSSGYLATLKLAKFKMYESYYKKNELPPSYKIEDLKQYTSENKEIYQNNLRKYDSVFNALTPTALNSDFYAINSHRITTSFNKIDREIDNAIANKNFDESKNLIENECDFIKNFYKKFIDFHKKSRDELKLS